LWCFKPEYCAILPFDEDEEPDQESLSLMELDDSSIESLDVALQARDVFLLSTEAVDVPPTSVVNGGNVDSPHGTTKELINKPKLLGEGKPVVESNLEDMPLIVDLWSFNGVSDPNFKIGMKDSPSSSSS